MNRKVIYLTPRMEVDAGIEKNENIEKLRGLINKAKLTKRNAKLIELYSEGRELKELAQIFEVTPSRASQLVLNALAKLRCAAGIKD